MKKIIILFTLCVMFTAFGGTAQAELIYQKDSYSGTLAQYNDIFSDATLTIAEEQRIWIFTDGYYKNGLDSGLILWNTDGTFMTANESAYTNNITHALGSDTISGRPDAAITIVLPAGTYRVSLVPYLFGDKIDTGKYNTLADLEAERAAYADYYSPDIWSANDMLGSDAFSFHIVYAPGAAVPLPASVLLLAPGLAGIGVLRRKLS